MFLYNLTLHKSKAINHLVLGHFSGTQDEEILISRGSVLELLKLDPNIGKLNSLLVVEVFGIVRSLVSFRPLGASKDYIAVGSDSGKIVILEYNPSKNVLEKIHQETFGKSGCRRAVPGQYLAVDPTGRSIMLGAVEKQKLVFNIYRDKDGKLSLSPGIEAHKNTHFVYSLIGINSNTENPMFACAQIDYEESDSDVTGEAVHKVKQKFTYYEHDVTNKKVIEKHTEHLEEHGNLLISVPSNRIGPGGVLICSENYLTYKNLITQSTIRCPIPRRKNDLEDSERGILIICYATYISYGMDSIVIFFLQTEQGDLLKVTLDDSDGVVKDINIKYFDTVHPAVAMCVFSTGFLFVASEFGNHYLYKITGLADDENEPEFSSTMHLDDGESFVFPLHSLKSLLLVDKIDSFSPIMDCNVANLADEDAPQIYLACGRGPRSSLRVLRHGLEVTDVATSELPGSPNALWTIRKRTNNGFDTYVLVSFVGATLVLCIGETVKEITHSDFLNSTSTLSCISLANDAAVQVHADGVRYIKFNRRPQDFKTPGKKKIVKCAVNPYQVVAALSGGELLYYGLEASGHLKDCHESTQMPDVVVCMALSSGNQMSRFVAVGLADNTIRIVSLRPSDFLSILSTQAVPAAPESLCIIEMEGLRTSLCLNIGLVNGALLRTALDPETGNLIDTKTRLLGSRPLKLFTISIQGQPAVLALSSRSWVYYSYHNKVHLTPLSYIPLDFASAFTSKQCPEGIIALTGRMMRLLTIEKLGVSFNEVSTLLDYTPRKLIAHPKTGHLITIETEHNAYTEESKKQKRLQIIKEMEEAAQENDVQLEQELIDDFLSEDLPDKTFGAPKAGYGKWASLIRVTHPGTLRTLSITRLAQNEAALSLALVNFQNNSEEVENDFVLLVGVAKDYSLSPRTISAGYILTFKFTNDGCDIELLHKTIVGDIPAAICPFHGRVLIGVGKFLRLYDLGKKKLLRKCENTNIPNLIVKIEAMGRRVYVSDVLESVFLVRYRSIENQLIIFADDTQPRWITTTALLDYNTIATADKFANVAVIRLSTMMSDDIEEEPIGNKPVWDRSLLNGASQKADFVANFHVGEYVTSLQKATLIPGGLESLVYTTLAGSVGIFIPFTTPDDQDFFQRLETKMRSEYPSLCGRDHLGYRSYYFPVKNVVDGDLCEQFNSLDMTKQNSIAHEMDRKPEEVTKKLEDIRTRYTF